MSGLDDDSLALSQAVLARAGDLGVTIATAESCTGGMVSAALTTPPGASSVFVAGFVTYSNAAKQTMLGVRDDALAAHGAVSEPVAWQMASGAAARAAAGLAVSITGIAGPGGSEFKPEGRVCFGLCNRGVTKAETVEFGALGRDAVRQAACHHALQLLLSALDTTPASAPDHHSCHND